MANDTSLPRASPAAVQLFACMARFEFALKECGFVSGEEGKRVSPGWADFEALAMQTNVLDRLSGSGRAQELLDQPPRRQLRRGNGFIWGDPVPLRDARTLCGAVRQVRNNLFHGGKAGADPRDDALCDAAVVALTFLLDVDPRVRAAFLERY